MPTVPRRAPAPWPTNASAYRTAITGALPGAGALVLLGGVLTPENLLAGAIALTGQLAVLFTARRWLKVGFSWVATTLSALALVAGSYEGEQGLTWSGIAQWDTTDIATVGLLVATSVLHTFVPNAPGRQSAAATGEYAGGEVLAVTPDDGVDMPAPPRDDTAGAPVAFSPVTTSTLHALAAARTAEAEPRADGTSRLRERDEDDGAPGVNQL